MEFVGKLIPNKKQVTEDIIRLVELPVEDHGSKLRGPRANLELANLSSMRPQEKALWFECARVKAILGSNARVLPSVKSGIRCYLNFAGVPMYACIPHAVLCLHR